MPIVIPFLKATPPLLITILFLALLGGCAHGPTGTSTAVQAASARPAAELRLAEFFKLPVGPKGLEPTDKLLRSAGQRVRVEGYLVKEEEPVPGLFMLTPVPTALAELADGPADYLPPATLFVHLAGENARKTLAYRPGPWSVTGILEVGGQAEPNGRMSYTRLKIDDPAAIVAPANQSPVLLDEGHQAHAHPH